MKHLTLLVSVDDPTAAVGAIEYRFGYGSEQNIFVQALVNSLSIFNSGEANPQYLEKSGYQFSIRFVNKFSSEIFRTEVGKVPLLKDII